MVEHHPVHNSEVYLLGLSPRPTVPPPSPPSPLTPTAVEPSTPIEQLCLDDVEDPENVPEASTRPEASTLAKQRITGAVHVLNTEATALRSLTHVYKTDTIAADGFNAAVEVIVRQSGDRGKLVIIGVGKSGHIGKKLVATFNSLGLHATFLHPTEALHGDLGKIRKHDVVLFITFSGMTPELLALLPHIDPALPTIVLTSHAQPLGCELIRQRPTAILLPAPIHEPETVSFGVSAPTTSTTVALALGDALAVVVSQELHPSVSSVFSQNHPGGAIGASFSKPSKIGHLAVPLCEIPVCATSLDGVLCAEILKTGYESPSGWVRVSDSLASPGRIRRLDAAELTRAASDVADFLVERSEWISIDTHTRISQAAGWIRDPFMSLPGYGETIYNEDSVLAVMENGEVVGVLEARQVLGWLE
ncbi:Uu.00g100480.m01.CDS01 [Anthostomella pinea]|uniref:Uu.00g100480.m01.CDS01 n=1 Tax=Anthostomella pinea TaxID=933095 RepID=A0AAI8YFG1_9PEZI|nr:Uu.00g100480.m01.CDS01 [Anthostomella pinea]